MRSLVPLLMSLVLVLSTTALAGCAGEKEDATPSPSAAASATPTAIAGGPTELQPLLSGRHDWNEPGTVLTEDGEELHVSLSGEGTVWRFRPNDPWTVTRADGAVLFSGTVVQEAELWEQAVGFVRLDDGRLVAYSLDIDANWKVYPAEDMCQQAAYWAEQDGESEVLKGFVDVVDTCLEELDIAPDIGETP